MQLHSATIPCKLAGPLALLDWIQHTSRCLQANMHLQFICKSGLSADACLLLPHKAACTEPPVTAPPQQKLPAHGCCSTIINPGSTAPPIRPPATGLCSLVDHLHLGCCSRQNVRCSLMFRPAPLRRRITCNVMARRSAAASADSVDSEDHSHVGFATICILAQSNY
jgi:hypothetical protein